MEFAGKIIVAATNEIISLLVNVYQNVDYVKLTNIQITGKRPSEANFST